MSLETIGNILNNIRKNHSPSQDLNRQMMMIEDNSQLDNDENFIMSNDPRVERLNPPQPATCKYCGAQRYTKGFNLGSNFNNRILWMPTGPEQCTCPEYEKTEAEWLAKKEAEHKAEEDHKFKDQIRRIISESGIGERFLCRTFDTFQVTDENQNAVRTAKRYANTFAKLTPKQGQPEPGRNGLFIAGPKGTGKTHLAVAIANQLIQNGTPVICMTMINLLERIKRTYAQGDIDEGTILSLYKTIPLLIIDDMGKEPPTEWAVSTIYNIVNGRYEAYLPTIVTTNYNNKTLISRMTPQTTRDSITAEATIDRLMEMCRGMVMTGQSWRQKI